MKILLIGNYSNDEQVSINRFVGLMEKGLAKSNHEVRKIQPQPVFGKFLPSAKGLGKWVGYIDKFFVFPYKLRQEVGWADLVCICDQSFSHYTRYLQNTPHFVICHDVLAIRSALGEIPENPISWTGRQYQSIILKGLKQAQYIACSSEKTRADVLHIAKIDPSKTTVIEDCLDRAYKLMPKEEAISKASQLNVPLDLPFILHVGNNSWYKNRLGLLVIFKNLISLPGLGHIRLFAVGKPLTDEMRAFIELNDLGKRVIQVVLPSNDDLRALYSIATALIFPSWQEGFGVPIIEAQTCGCPVFTSNRLPMTEVGADAAVYFDPKEPELAAKIIANTLLQPEQMSQMRQKGFANAARFTFERMIQSYCDLVSEICGSTESGKA